VGTIDHYQGPGKVGISRNGWVIHL